MPARTWTLDELKHLLPECSTLKELVERLGLVPNSQTCRRIRKALLKEQLKPSFKLFDETKCKEAFRTWSDEQLIEAIPKATNFSEVLSLLGLRSIGSNFKTVRKAIERLELDVSHFKVTRSNKKKPLSERLVKGVNTENSYLKRLLVQESLLEEKCALCGCLSRWNNKALVLQLDHINGDHTDNRLENLRLLCPNCHSQTDTFGGKNGKRYIAG